MQQTLTDLLDKLLTGRDLSQDDVVWGLLLVGLVFASVHLVTLFITRWGDTRATSKSLICSLLLHLTCALGLVAVEPNLPQAAIPSRRPPEQTVPVQRILAAEAEKPVADAAGNSPVWQDAFAESVEPERLDHTSPELEFPDTQRQETRPTPARPLNLPDSLTPLDVSENAPQTTDAAYQADRRVAETALDLDDPDLNSAPSLTEPLPATRSRNRKRPGQFEPLIDRVASRGTVDRQDPEFVLDRRLTPQDAVPAPQSVNPRRTDADGDRVRRGPAETTLTKVDPVNTTNPTEARAPSRPLPQRQRLNPRRPQPAIDNSRSPDREPTTIAKRTPIPRPLALDRSPTRVEPDAGPQPMIRQPAAIQPLRKRRNSVAPTYQLRDLAQRQQTAQRFGGTAASERAVELSLAWLANAQHPAGYWDANRHGSGKVQFDENRVDRMYAGIQSDTGVTALAILAFLGAGYTHEVGPYTEQVDRGLQWLVKQQGRDGNLCGKATHFARMYCHAMATYAMAEAYGMQSDTSTDVRLRNPLEKAIRFIIDNQHRETGGWRYRKGQTGDTSMFGWQLMALKSAEIAGLKIPSLVKQRMYTFLKKGSRGADGGLAAYRQGEAVTETMTAEALFCKQMLGIQRSNPACSEAVDYLLQHIPSRSNLNLYYWYYGTLAMYQHGGEAWRSSEFTLTLDFSLHVKFQHLIFGI